MCMSAHQLAASAICLMLMCRHVFFCVPIAWSPSCGTSNGGPGGWGDRDVLLLVFRLIRSIFSLLFLKLSDIFHSAESVVTTWDLYACFATVMSHVLNSTNQKVHGDFFILMFICLCMIIPSWCLYLSFDICLCQCLSVNVYECVYVCRLPAFLCVGWMSSGCLLFCVGLLCVVCLLSVWCLLSVLSSFCVYVYDWLIDWIIIDWLICVWCDVMCGFRWVTISSNIYYVWGKI